MDWYDRDARLEKRRLMYVTLGVDTNDSVKEATRGYFHDFHEIRSHGGKTWRSPTTMIRGDRALFFPDIMGKSLADGVKRHTADMLYDRISVVAIMTSRVSEEHTRSFYGPSLERFQGHADFQLVQINLQENKLKAYLLSLFMSTLRRVVPREQQVTYLLSNQNMEMLREPMGLDNKHVGYTYLVGADGRIRWAGCGFAEADEARALMACTGVLLDRRQKNK